MDLNAKVTRNGQTLTARVWLLIEDAQRFSGQTCRVVQGGFKGGGGVSASAGTHDVGDVFDLSMSGLSDADGRAIVDALRRRNGCAWIRSARYGWTKTSAHIHCVMRDSYYGLSAGAKKQVVEYDNGYDGLSGSGKDPFPRPPQKHWEPVVVIPTPDPEPVPLPAPTYGDDNDMVLMAPSGAYYLLTGGHLVSLDQQSAANAKAGGLPLWKVATAAAWANIARTYPPVPA